MNQPVFHGCVVTMVGFVSFCSVIEDWSRLWISGNFDSATPSRASTWKSHHPPWQNRWSGGHPIGSEGNDDRLGRRGSGLRGWNLMQTYQGMILLRDFFIPGVSSVHWVGCHRCHIKWPLFSKSSIPTFLRTDMEAGWSTQLAEAKQMAGSVGTWVSYYFNSRFEGGEKNCVFSTNRRIFCFFSTLAQVKLDDDPVQYQRFFQKSESLCEAWE